MHRINNTRTHGHTADLGTQFPTKHTVRDTDRDRDRDKDKYTDRDTDRDKHTGTDTDTDKHKHMDRRRGGDFINLLNLLPLIFEQMFIAITINRTAHNNNNNNNNSNNNNMQQRVDKIASLPYPILLLKFLSSTLPPLFLFLQNSFPQPDRKNVV